MARGDQRLRRAHPTARSSQRRGRARDDEGIIPVLARAASEVEAAVQRGRVLPSVRTKFQVVALLVREERARVRAEISNDARRSAQLKRLDGIATILAKTAARDTSLLDAARRGRRGLRRGQGAHAELLQDAGLEAAALEVAPPEPPADTAAATPERRVVPQSVVSRQLANPFLAPDFSAVRPSAAPARRLASWELLGPLFRSFERAGGGASPCMALPEPSSLQAPGGRTLMPHQAQLVAAAAAGHRTFLLADEPGLGKTAQALLAAQAANAYPLLVVVPNVVKTNWAPRGRAVDPHQVGHRDPRRRRHDRRLRRHRRRQLRGARPPRRLARRLRLPRHGRRRGALHQEQDVAALAARPAALRAHPGPRRAAAADGADRHPADQRHRGLPGDLAVPRLDRREEAARRADAGARGDRADPGRPRVLPRRPPVRDRPGHRASPQGRRRRRHPRPADRRPAGRARRRGRPLDPRGRAGARPPAGGALRERTRTRGRPVRSSRASTTTWSAGSPPGSGRTRPRPQATRTCSP